MVERHGLSKAGYEKAREKLERKYSGHARRVRAEIASIRHYPKIGESDTKKLEEYSDKVMSLVTSLKENGSDGDLSEVSAFYMLVSEKVHHTYIKNYHRCISTTGRQDSFETFANWLAEEIMWEKRAKEATATSSEHEEPRSRMNSRGAKKTYAATRQASRVFGRLKCVVCRAEHATEDCTELQSWEVAKRYAFCKTEGLCFRCLHCKHRGTSCRRFPGCAVEGCGGTHHSLLHASGSSNSRNSAEVARPAHSTPTLSSQAKEFIPRTAQGRVCTKENIPTSSAQASVTPGASFNTASQGQAKRTGKIAFQTAPVLVHCQDRFLKLNALIDTCSDASYISKAAADELGLHGEEVQFELGTVNGKKDVKITSGAVRIASTQSKFEASLDVHVISSLEGASVCTSWQDVKQRWPHMADIPFPKMAEKEVDLLIGLSPETMPIFVPLKTVSGANSSPVAVLTPLG